MNRVEPKMDRFILAFYEGRIEYQVKVMDYERNDEIGDYEEIYYNISLPIIKELGMCKTQVLQNRPTLSRHKSCFVPLYSVLCGVQIGVLHIPIKEYLRERGNNTFEYMPFEIDIDIPKPEHRDIGTYTVETEDGKRLQISAAMLMPWCFIYAAK